MTSKVVYQAKDFSVCIDEFDYNFAHERREIEYIVQPSVVIAVPVTEEGQIILVEHWRPILNEVTLECPGGRVEPGESIDAAILRELAEEIGVRPRKLTELGSFFSSVGVSNEEIHCFVAEDLESVPKSRSSSDSKRMKVHRFSMDELRTRVQTTILRDGKTQIALARFFS